MTEQDIKHQLAFHYLGIIASRSGFKYEKPAIDYGVDAMVERIEKIKKDKGFRYAASGISIDVQLKSTTYDRIDTKEGHILFDVDCEIKNYNDIIRRFQNRKKLLYGLIPIILVVYILPDDSEKWIQVSNKNGLDIKGGAYWFYPNENLEKTNNKSSIRIKIPIEQKVDLDFCEHIFNLLYSDLKLNS